MNVDLETPGNNYIGKRLKYYPTLFKQLDKLSEEEIISVNIPTGVPLIYTFDNDLNVIHKEYLIDQDKLKKKQEIIANQGKAKWN